MKKKKVMFIFGTRPEVIKLAPVIEYTKKHSKVLKPIICVTSQHKQMLSQMMEYFNLKSDYDLEIMKDNQSLAGMTSRLFYGLEKTFDKIKPDFVVVQGDTTSAFISGLMSYYYKIPVAHVEAGLRTYSKFSPFPEEVNRRLISHVADLHFAPTLTAKNNLIKEGISQKSIHVSGNTVIDALFMMLEKKVVLSNYLENILKSHKVILVTAHRRESFGYPFEQMCRAFKTIVQNNKDVAILYPVHLNPNIKKTVDKLIRGADRIYLTEPLGYDVFAKLMSRCHIVLTDSGGIQEEAPSLKKPVLVMRDHTERPEGIKAGVSRLVGTKASSIVSAVEKLLNNKNDYSKMISKSNPYGDGMASKRIVKTIEGIFRK